MWWPWRRRSDADFAEEIQAHIAHDAKHLMEEEGLSPDEAQARARRAFGNATKTQEEFYESRRPMWLDDLRRDTVYALRGLRRSPGFAATAILTLSLGIGANTAIFSVINAVVFRPLQYQAPATLIFVDPGPLTLTPSWLRAAWRDQAHRLSDFAGFSGPRPATLVLTDAPHQIDTADVTWNFLSMLGVRPVVGRDFLAADANPGMPETVGILSHEFWQRVFGSDPAIVGRTVTITESRLRIVGVAPAGFRFPTTGALPTWGIPTDTQPDLLRVASENGRFNVIARLTAGSTHESATDELRAIAQHAVEARGERIDLSEIQAAPLQERLVGNVAARLWLVMGAVAFVLLIACVNVANLLLVRASSRRRELALRMALGAGRRRVARLVITESLLLALLGSAGALLFAEITSDIARTLLVDRVPHVDGISLDLAVLAFNTVVAVAVGVVSGLVSLPDVNMSSLFDSGAPTVTGRSRLRWLLLSAETGVTFVLVVGAALFAQTLWNMTTQDRGFDADRLLTVRVAPGLPPDLDRHEARAGSKYFSWFFDDLRDRLERVPGVASAAAISLGPLEGSGAGLLNIAVNGRSIPTESTTPVAFATPGYLRTMRIPLISGRDFDNRDRVGTDLVAVVNEAFQRRFLPEGNILGSRIASGSGPEIFTIIGVARDTPDRSLRDAPEPLLMAPLAQMPGVHISWGALTFVLRTVDNDPLRLAPDVRQAIWAINPNIVITAMTTMRARLALGMRAERDSALVFGLFACVSLLMAAIGVYGMAAYTTAQRTREIGIRIALGAGGAAVGRLVVSQTLWPMMLGISVGVAAAAMLTRFVSSMLYGVTALNPAAFAGAALVLVSVALIATAVPAQRAARLDPLVALRYE